MQSARTDSNKTKRHATLAAAALIAGLAAFSMTACDSTESSPACVTTADDSTTVITLTSPSCGTSFKVGSTMTVTWTVKDDPDAPDAVDLMMSVDEGKSWGYMRSGSIPDTSPMWGAFDWEVKESLTIGGASVSLAGKKALVRVMQYSTLNAKQISTMVDPITITAP